MMPTDEQIEHAAKDLLAELRHDASPKAVATVVRELRALFSAHPKPASPIEAGQEVSELTPKDFDRLYREVWSSMPTRDRLWRFANKVYALALRSGASAQPAEGAEQDAKRWNMLPAFFEEYQIDALKLYRDIDALITEKEQPHDR